MLTYRDLKAIQDGHRRNPDVMTLLREVKRLRELATASYGVLAFMPVTGHPPEARAAAMDLCQRLRLEPAVQAYLMARKKQEDLEFRRRTAASTAPTGRPGPRTDLER